MSIIRKFSAIQNFPEIIFSNIVSFMEPRDIFALKNVNKRFYSFLKTKALEILKNDPYLLMETYFIEEFPSDFGIIPFNDETVARFFSKMLQFSEEKKHPGLLKVLERSLIFFIEKDGEQTLDEMIHYDSLLLIFFDCFLSPEFIRYITQKKRFLCSRINSVEEHGIKFIQFDI